MLLLFARQDEATFALDAARVVEVLPSILLEPPVGEPSRVEGLFRYRGRVLRAVDLGRLVVGRPARNLLSARLIVVDDPRVAVGTAAHAVLAQALGDLERIVEVPAAGSDRDPGRGEPRAAWLGPVFTHGDELVRMIYPEYVLDA